MVQSSADGNVWSTTRTVVNDDPARYDNALPEIAVDETGRVGRRRAGLYFVMLEAPGVGVQRAADSRTNAMAMSPTIAAPVQ